MALSAPQTTVANPYGSPSAAVRPTVKPAPQKVPWTKADVAQLIKVHNQIAAQRQWTGAQKEAVWDKYLLNAAKVVMGRATRTQQAAANASAAKAGKKAPVVAPAAPSAVQEVAQTAKDALNIYKQGAAIAGGVVTAGAAAGITTAGVTAAASAAAAVAIPVAAAAIIITSILGIGGQSYAERLASAEYVAEHSNPTAIAAAEQSVGHTGTSLMPGAGRGVVREH